MLPSMDRPPLVFNNYDSLVCQEKSFSQYFCFQWAKNEEKPEQALLQQLSSKIDEIWHKADYKISTFFDILSFTWIIFLFWTSEFNFRTTKIWTLLVQWTTGKKKFFCPTVWPAIPVLSQGSFNKNKHSLNEWYSK